MQIGIPNYYGARLERESLQVTKEVRTNMKLYWSEADTVHILRGGNYPPINAALVNGHGVEEVTIYGVFTRGDEILQLYLCDVGIGGKIRTEILAHKDLVDWWDGEKSVAKPYETIASAIDKSGTIEQKLDPIAK